MSELKEFPRDLDNEKAEEWLAHNVENISNLYYRAQKMARHYGLDLVLDFVEDGDYEPEHGWYGSSC